jgi:hypothetical protein
VADDESRDRPEACFQVRFEKVAEPIKHSGVQILGFGHEIRPEAERTRHVAAMLGKHRQLLADEGGLVTTPHPRTTGARPEIHANPRTILVKLRQRFSQASCAHI